MALVVSAGRARWRREHPPYGFGREVPVNFPPHGIVLSRASEPVCAGAMLSVAKIQRRDAWRYYIRGVAFGDGRRPVGQSLNAQELAGLPSRRWLGRGLRALELTEGAEVSERQLELLFGEGRHPDADRIERGLLDDGVDAATARRLTVGAADRGHRGAQADPGARHGPHLSAAGIAGRAVGAGRCHRAPGHRAGP
ncbi:relaxase domain-containing protein [Streptomyces sp. NPDC047853]|uniref:relaxase domain-containing protein n=1 Tax=Streptomyces sp. NPDC047853 TaxID=3365489 RepID=UPI003717DDB2